MGTDDKEEIDYSPGARYCSYQAGGELFFINFLHGIGSLTGCGEIIDTMATNDHYKALEKKQSELQSKLEGARWFAIQMIIAAQTSSKSLDEAEKDLPNKITFEGVDQVSIDALYNIKQDLETKDDFYKTSIQDKLNLLNFSALVNTIFLYLICFVLLVFVKWN